jgi:uncharacterized protein (DUF4415 family)
MREAGKSRTDWKKLKSISDDAIDFSDSPEVTQFARAVVRQGLEPEPAKKLLTLRVDADVLSWFRAQGRGYQTRINTLLRAYKKASSQTKRIRRSAKPV